MGAQAVVTVCLSLRPQQTLRQRYWWFHPSYLAFQCFSCRLHCQWQAVWDFFFGYCYCLFPCTTTLSTAECKQRVSGLINVVDVRRVNMKIQVLWNVLLSPWSRVLLGKLILLPVVRKFLGSDRIQMFISVFTRTLSLSLSWGRWIHSTPILYI